MPDDRLPQISFRDGMLTLFADGHVMTIRGWPEPEARRKPVGFGEWRPFTPRFRLVRRVRASPKKKTSPVPRARASPQLELALALPAPPPKPARKDRSVVADERRCAFDGFRSSLPKAVAARVEKFPSSQWPLLQVFHAEPRALEVCAASPAFVFAVAHAAEFNERIVADPVKFAAALVLRRQRDALGRLGFPATETAARIVAKLVTESTHVETLRQLRDLVSCEETAKTLSHLPAINTGLIELLADPVLREMGTHALFEEIAMMAPEKYRAGVVDVLAGLLHMHARLEPARPFGRWTSVAQIRNRHDVLAADFRRLVVAAGAGREFPRPPLLGSNAIVPILSEAELLEEGHSQENCVGSYGARILSGACAIYRVLQPERATLSIVRGHDGDWDIGELLRRGNRPVAAETVVAVRAWLAPFAVSA